MSRRVSEPTISYSGGGQQSQSQQQQQQLQQPQVTGGQQEQIPQDSFFQSSSLVTGLIPTFTNILGIEVMTGFSQQSIPFAQGSSAQTSSINSLLGFTSVIKTNPLTWVQDTFMENINAISGNPNGDISSFSFLNALDPNRNDGLPKAATLNDFVMNPESFIENIFPNSSDLLTDPVSFIQNLLPDISSMIPDFSQTFACFTNMANSVPTALTEGLTTKLQSVIQDAQTGIHNVVLKMGNGFDVTNNLLDSMTSLADTPYTGSFGHHLQKVLSFQSIRDIDFVFGGLRGASIPTGLSNYGKDVSVLFTDVISLFVSAINRMVSVIQTVISTTTSGVRDASQQALAGATNSINEVVTSLNTTVSNISFAMLQVPNCLTQSLTSASTGGSTGGGQQTSSLQITTGQN